MADTLLKAHGAIANGTVSHDDDGRWRAFLLVRDFGKDLEQKRGPEFFNSKDRALEWVYRQAGHHGFRMGEFDVEIEESD